MDHAGFFRPCGAAWERCLPSALTMLDETALLSRPWPLLVCSRRGAESLSLLPRPPLCRTVLMPQEAAGAWLRARQVVGCGLSPRCSLTLSGLSPRPVLCVQRALTALDGTVIEPQDIPLSLHWSRLPPETLLLAAGAWLLAKGQVPEIS